MTLLLIIWGASFVSLPLLVAIERYMEARRAHRAIRDLLASLHQEPVA